MRLQFVLQICFVLTFILCQCLTKSVSNDLKLKVRRSQTEDDEEIDDTTSQENVTKIVNQSTPEGNGTEDNGSENSDENDSHDEDEEETPDVPQDGPKLLVLLVDGFRWDYVARDKALKGFRRIGQSGVSAKYVKPIFPSDSYPNWYAITTGLYGESHGMIQNLMYSQSRHDLFAMAPHPNASHNHWWNQTEPIWVTAERNGVKTAMYLWDGCQVRIAGIKPFICHKYKSLYNTSEAHNETKNYIKNILDDFANDKYRLALLYYELVDRQGHQYGPRSGKTRRAIRDTDRLIDFLYESIQEKQLEDSVNVVIVSDHGMLSKQDFHTIHMEDILDFNDIELFLGEGPVSQILPEQGKQDEVYDQLRQAQVKGLNVYKKDNIPDRFHYKHNHNVLPILLTTDKGYLIQAPRIKSKVYPDYERTPQTNITKGGDHGFDPEYVNEMRAIMYGFGPAFRKDYVSEPLEMVDHYNLMCKLIGITAHPNNGSEYRVDVLLKEAEDEDNDSDYSDDNSDEDKDNGDGDGVTQLQLHSFLIYISLFVTTIIAFILL